jgi:hypothetical protein
MLQKTKTVEYELDGQAVRLTVGRATALVGMRRSVMVFNARAELKDKPVDTALSVLRTITYPDLTACLVAAEGIPAEISFEDFCNLPDDLIALWEDAVYEVNPHWNPAGTPEEVASEAEKKV